MATKLYVGNISFNTTEDSLRSLFQSEGRTVQDVAVIMDRETGRPRGFAFVQMGSPEDAQSAISSLERPGSGRPAAQRQRSQGTRRPPVTHLNPEANS
jgi:RNA recognition motif-containing protein